MDNYNEEPPGLKIIDAGGMDISSTDIPLDDIEGKPRVGFWHQFTQPVLYPAGSSVCSRCTGLHILIRQQE